MKFTKSILFGTFFTLLFSSVLLGQSARKKINFNDSWKFHLGDVIGARYLDFDDHDWKAVDVPHDWSIHQAFSPDNASSQAYLPGGIGWYRKTFTLPKNYKEKKVKILFNGVYHNSKVWINGHYLGNRPNGYVSFSYNLTNYLNYGTEENVIAVRVDHSHEADSRWYTGSGIVGNVWLKVMNPVHFAQWGIFITTPKAKRSAASVQVISEIVNSTDQARKLTIQQTVSDSTGNSRSINQRIVRIPSHSHRKIKQKLKVENPSLWAPAHPHLYKMKSIIKDGNRIVDKKLTSFGIRTFKFDTDEGFFINGKSLEIKGVCLHNDAGSLGSAFHKREWRYRLQLMKEMGANAIRTGHSPPAPGLLDLADEMGFLVVVEAFDEWRLGKKKWIQGRNVGQDLGASGFKKYYSLYGYSDFFEKWAKRDIQDMVRHFRNHSSVIMWSIGNEIDYPNDPYTDPQRNDYKKWRPSAWHITEIAHDLYEYVKEVDSTRPVTAAIANAPLANRIGYTQVLDVVGYNYQPQYYEEDHKKFPDRKIYGSETGESYQAWLTAKNNDYVAGQFIWTGVDYLGEAGEFPDRGFASEFVTLDDYRKPGFYYRKSLWTDKPMVYIATINPKSGKEKPLSVSYPHVISSWNWKSYQGNEIKIMVFTNCESIELFLNNRSLGTKKLANSNKHILYWEVPYQAGTLKAVAKTNEKKVRTYKLETTGDPYKVVLKPRHTQIEANDGDIVSINVLVTDQEGNIVPNADNLVHFTVDGTGKNIGAGNANLYGIYLYKDNKVKVYHGKSRIVLQSNGQEGAIHLTATSEELKSAKIVIQTE